MLEQTVERLSLQMDQLRDTKSTIASDAEWAPPIFIYSALTKNCIIMKLNRLVENTYLNLDQYLFILLF